MMLNFLPRPYVSLIKNLPHKLLALSFVDLCWEIYHAPKIKITNTPHICAASTLEVHKNMIFIHLKMFDSYTGGEHKNMLDRFIHQINAPSSCEYLSWKILLQKRDMGLCKRKSEKRKKKERVEKMDIKVSEILKTMGT